MKAKQTEWEQRVFYEWKDAARELKYYVQEGYICEVTMDRSTTDILFTVRRKRKD